MELNLFTISLAVVALLSLLVGAVVLIRFNWFSGWLIGSIGLGALSLALFCSIIILSFNNYSSTTETDAVGTISFTQLGPKHFKAELAEAQGEVSQFELKGDSWQIDTDIISWSPFFERQGMKPYYKLNSVHSSYATLNEAERFGATSVKVESGIGAIFLYQMAKSKSITAIYSVRGSTGALPMRDGALYSIRVNKAGLISRPENQQALAAVR